MEKRLKNIKTSTVVGSICIIKMFIFDVLPYCTETCTHNAVLVSTLKKITHFFVQSALNLGPNQPTLEKKIKVHYEGTSTCFVIETLNAL